MPLGGCLIGACWRKIIILWVHNRHFSTKVPYFLIENSSFWMQNHLAYRARCRCSGSVTARGSPAPYLRRIAKKNEKTGQFSKRNGPVFSRQPIILFRINSPIFRFSYFPAFWNREVPRKSGGIYVGIRSACELREFWTEPGSVHLNTKFLVFDAQFLVFNAQFLGFNTKFIIFTLTWTEPGSMDGLVIL